MSNTRLTSGCPFESSKLLTVAANQRTDAGTDVPPLPDERELLTVDERGVWRRRQNTGKKERKKERVCDRRRHRRRRTSFCGDQRKVRACVRPCVFFAPGSSKAFVVAVRFAAFVCAAVLLFSPPIFNPPVICFCLDVTLLCSRRSFLRDWI